MTMDNELKIKMYALTLDCPSPYALAKFYAELLKWEIVFHDETFACVAPFGVAQGGYPGIMFQRNDAYKAPVWPNITTEQQQMAHIDFAVNDLPAAVQFAINCGATVASQQFSDSWTVMFDPAGHPFCLCQMKAIVESPDFALL